jgi:hypothetical protein
MLAAIKLDIGWRCAVTADISSIAVNTYRLHRLDTFSTRAMHRQIRRLITVERI